MNPSRADLLTSLGIGERDNIPDLEALLEVQIGGGVPAPPVSH